jgi:hypothetical protein
MSTMNARPPAAFCIAAVLAAGCATAARPVVPGLALAPARVTADTVVFDRSVVRGDSVTPSGTRTAVVRQVGRELVVEQRFPAGAGTIVDTAVADVRTWRALEHRSHQPTRVMRFRFADGRAAGTVAAHDSVREVSQDLGGAIFDSNVLEWVIAALPLRDGFRGELPFFIYERGGRVPMAVDVRGRERIDGPWGAPRDAWVVSVAVPGAPATIWVDAATHAVLRTQYEITARGMRFVDARRTPL